MDIELHQISLENNYKLGQLENVRAGQSLGNIELLNNKIHVMNQKQKSKLKKMAVAGKRAMKAFDAFLSKDLHQKNKEKS